MQYTVPYEIAALLMGGTMCLFMALYFMMDHRGRKSPKRFLAGFMFIYGLTFIDNFFDVSNILYRYPHLAGLVSPTVFLLGPFLYFYIRDMCDPESYQLDRKSYRHFVFPFIAIALMLTFYSFPENIKFAILMEQDDLTLTPYIFVGLAGLTITHLILPFQILYYLVKSYGILRQHFTTLKQFFSNVEDHKLDWLRILILMLSVQWLLYAFAELVGWPENWGKSVETMTSLVDVAIIYFLSFKGLRHDAVLRQETPISQPTPNVQSVQEDTTTSHPPKYAKSALSESDSERILHKLNQALELEQLYKDSMLSLRSLSDHTRISPNYISQVINQTLDCNFFDFVNQYRIQAAKEQLIPRKDEKPSVLEVAHAVGFNSKSTFNTAFKRYTGLTPTEYRKQQLSLETSTS